MSKIFESSKQQEFGILKEKKRNITWVWEPFLSESAPRIVRLQGRMALPPLPTLQNSHPRRQGALFYSTWGGGWNHLGFLLQWALGEKKIHENAIALG